MSYTTERVLTAFSFQWGNEYQSPVKSSALLSIPFSGTEYSPAQLLY